MKLRPSRYLVYLAAVVAAVAIGWVGRQMLPTGDGEKGGVTSTSGVIGGPFTLVDHTGRRVTDADFRGRYMLVYFGYTYCPDACPTSLTVMGEALQLLGDAASKVVPIFITVDPARDTPAHLAMYVGYFHSGLVGLTGTEEEVAQVAKEYRVYYTKVQDKEAPADDYTMDHTSIIYLMGPDGKFLAHFAGATAKAEAVARRLREFLG